MNLSDLKDAISGIQVMPELALKAVTDGITGDPQELMLFGGMDLPGESYAVRMMRYFLKHSKTAGFIPPEVPVHEDDLIRSEFSMKVGRADLVVFHIDGSASVIEVKDGATGYRDVVAGIGQVSLYACQLGLKDGSIKSVRRVLAWDSMNSNEHNQLVTEACKSAGVIPVKLPSKAQIKACFAELVIARRDALLAEMSVAAGFESHLDMLNMTNESVGAFLSLMKSLKSK